MSVQPFKSKSAAKRASVAQYGRTLPIVPVTGGFVLDVVQAHVAKAEAEAAPAAIAQLHDVATTDVATTEAEAEPVAQLAAPAAPAAPAAKPVSISARLQTVIDLCSRPQGATSKELWSATNAPKSTIWSDWTKLAEKKLGCGRSTTKDGQAVTYFLHFPKA